MINKTLIQIILFIFVLLAGGAYYYSFNKGSIDNKIAGKEDAKIKVKENVSNLIENIFYTSTDSAGNKFEIKQCCFISSNNFVNVRLGTNNVKS